MPNSPSLLLFDIDGTLIDTGGAGRRAIIAGLEELYPEEIARVGTPVLDLAGCTDWGLLRDQFGELGIPDTDEERRRFYGCYLAHLKENLTSAGPVVRLLPGVMELFAALQHGVAAGEVKLGLVTGNVEAGAQLKVGHFGLAEHFEFGAYGDDHYDRNRLGPVAMERAAALYGSEFPGSSAWIIGDTPKDIRCARAFGANVLAVGSGGIDMETLAGHTPDSLMADLSDTAAVLATFGLH